MEDSVKIWRIRPAVRFIWETIAIVTMEDEQELVCDLSNDTVSMHRISFKYLCQLCVYCRMSVLLHFMNHCCLY